MRIAIVASGNCSLTLVDVRVTAATALVASGNAEVTVHGGSHLEGSRHAVQVHGNGSVTSYGTTLVGGVDASGNGTFENID